MKLFVPTPLRIVARIAWILAMLSAVVVMTQTASTPFVYGAF
ncbi:hypothetical protein [Sphingomonas sp. SUN039]|nr:hypothetical protein [Sphingomonas sp. SUN039]